MQDQLQKFQISNNLNTNLRALMNEIDYRRILIQKLDSVEVGILDKIENTFEEAILRFD